MSNKINADRFTGFADIYNSARPSCPKYVVEVITKYLRYNPDVVVDIGCGTGLSSMIWADASGSVIGVEPSDDMRNVASANSKNCTNITFINAFSDNTGLDDGFADIITCSQSFHWMEPVSTLKEVNRILKKGGVFAAYDCDWPPVCSAPLEMAYEKLFNKVRKIELSDDKYKNSFIRYPKENHLSNIKTSGYFKYVREIVFVNKELCDAKRYYKIAVSQGGLQAIIKQDMPLIMDDLKEFNDYVEMYFSDKTIEIGFCYRMRLGVK